MTDLDLTDLESKLTAAESTLESFAEGLDEGDDEGIDVSETVEDGLEALGDDGAGVESIVGDLETVVTVIDEAESILESIDFSELPDAVDEDELLHAIDAGEIPDALRDSEDADVVKLRQVIRAINMRELLGAADVSDLWEAKRGFDDAVDDLAASGDDEDAGVVEEAASAVTDDDESLVGDDGGVTGDEGGLVGDEDDELVETDVDDLLEMGAQEAMDDFELEGGDLGEYEELIQQQAIESVDAFRDALLKAHGKFERVVESNRERTRNIDRSSNSRNPTAVSTISTDRADLASTPNYSTMPRQVRHSNAPTRRLIYGDRFRRERERRGYE